MPSSVSGGENVAQIPINQQSKNISMYSGDRKLNLPIVITVAAPHTSANCHQSKEAATNEGIQAKQWGILFASLCLYKQ